jgi:magnesium transporter
MLVYTQENGALKPYTLTGGETIPPSAVWIDLLHVTPDEEASVEHFLGIGIPTHEEMYEIEVSSRLYQERDALYMTTVLVTNAETREPESHAFTFVLVGERLITIRYSDPQPFRAYATRVEHLPSSQHTGSALYVGLVETIVNYTADVLEHAGRIIDHLTKGIFHARAAGKADSKPDYEHLLVTIGGSGDLVSKTHESLVTLNRMATFAAQSSHVAQGDTGAHLAVLAKDIAALSDHTMFLSNKVNFLLDATLGMIGMEQNNIIKIVSVAAVVFLPPTLIASIYGMNFDFMPELKWLGGYPLAIVLMVLSACLPYLYFKRRKWL